MKVFDHKLPDVIAHRGGRALAPENTLAAFKMCLDNEIYGIECDVQRCRTGELVLMHEAWIDDTTNGTGLIVDLDFDELRKFSAGIKFAPFYEAERVPTLAEALELISGKAVVFLEIKMAPTEYPGIEKEILQLLEHYKYSDKVVICSFDHESLLTVHRLSTKYKLAMLTCGVPYNLKTYAAGLGARALNPDFTAFRAGYVDIAREAGMDINVWTANGPLDWARAVNAKVAGVITDDPLGFRAFLEKMDKSDLTDNLIR